MYRLAWYVFAIVLLPQTENVFGAESSSATVKNVIVMFADGAGYNTWDAASMVQGRWDPAAGRSTQVYDGPGWVKYGCSTYPLNLAKVPSGTGRQDAEIVTVKAEVRVADAVRAACRRLSLAEPVQGEVQLFSGTARGLCVELPDWQYPICCDLSTGQIRFDNLQGRWGDQKHLDRLLQAYAARGSVCFSTIPPTSATIIGGS